MSRTYLFALTRRLLRTTAFVSMFIAGVMGLFLGAMMLVSAGFIHVTVLGLPSDTPFHLVVEVAALNFMIGAICFVLVAYIFLLMAQIIDTASSGDPFVTENAQRLTRIAWLLLAIQAMGQLCDIVTKMVPKKGPYDLSVGISSGVNVSDNGVVIRMMPGHITNPFSVDFSFSAIGILAALLIFVLAQIFRRGSEMRAELEGTV